MKCTLGLVSLLQTVPKRRSLRFLVIGWLNAWIIPVPLFHIHLPDTTDRWSALQSGGPHTVFTPSLPGEFSHPFHDHFGHLSQRAVNSPELSIALLSNSDEDQKTKHLSVLSADGPGLNAELSSWPFEYSGTYRGPPRSYTLPAFRAPPRIVCV